MYSAAASAVKCRQLPPEFWFKNELPWWMDLKPSNVLVGADLHDRQVKPRKIPLHATTEEVLMTVRQAVLEYGRHLHSLKKHELDPESMKLMLEEKHKRIAAMRARQGLPSMEPIEQEEDRILSDAYQAMCRAENNETVRVGKLASWTGWHDKLNRLKCQGAFRVLLKLDMNWQQFDAVFRAISTNADGTIQEDEFVAAFRSGANLADLLRRDVAGESSRKGGRRRRLLKAEGWHGSGARVGDSDAKQIVDALHAILETLEESKINLREAFASFDRNGSGEVSVAEFASLIRTLGGLGLTKRQIYHLMSSMDGNFDRTVRYNEFMEYFLVIWVDRLRQLRKSALRPDKTISESAARKKMAQSKRRLRRAEHAIKLTFGSGYAAAAARAGAVLPGAFSALTRRMNMDTSVVRSTFTPMSPAARDRVSQARNIVLTGSPQPPTSPIHAPSRNKVAKTVRFDMPQRSNAQNPSSGRANVNSQSVTVSGRQTLQRYKMAKKNKIMRGEEHGPVQKDYGRHGIREIGMPSQTNAFEEFPSGFRPSA